MNKELKKKTNFNKSIRLIIKTKEQVFVHAMRCYFKTE